MFSTTWVSLDGARGRWSSKRKRTVGLADALFTVRWFGVFGDLGVFVDFGVLVEVAFPVVSVGLTFGKFYPPFCISAGFDVMIRYSSVSFGNRSANGRMTLP